MIPLDPDEAHVWYLNPTSIPRGADARMVELLSSDERQRYAGFRTEALGREYLLTRALVRTTLSLYADIKPEHWRFLAGPNGRPYLKPQMGVPLHFNLSNTRGLIACAIGLDEELGLDVEHVDSDPAILALADQYFSAAEVAALRALPLEQQPARFAELWTLKEAYLKALGVGLRGPLDQPSFELSPAGATAFLDGATRDAADTWHFKSSTPSPGHRAAIAVRRRGSVQLRVRERAAVPIEGR